VRATRPPAALTETAVLENKRLGGLLNLIRESQQSQPSGMRTSKGPKRRDQTRHMFSVGCPTAPSTS
jgi:hypothetical protein